MLSCSFHKGTTSNHTLSPCMLLYWCPRCQRPSAMQPIYTGFVYQLISLTLYPSGLTTGTMTNSMFSNNVFTCTGIKGERQTGMTRIELELYKLMDYNALLFNKSALINRCIHQLKICNNLYVHLGFFHMCDQVLGKEWAH